MKFLKPTSCEINPQHPLMTMFIRGVIGLGLMGWSFNFLVSIPLLGFSMLGVSILLLKGCPACWGMHMVNLARNSMKIKVVEAELVEDSSLLKKPYQPKDMAEHLFPPADVARFRREREAKEASVSIQKKDAYVG